MNNSDNILQKIKKENDLDFINDLELKEVIESFLAYVFYLYDSLQKCDDDFLYNFKKHTMIVYMGSVIEALTYYFAKIKLGNNDKAKRKYLEIEELKIHQKIKESDFIICKIEKKEISLNDSINFKALIDGLKDKKLITQEIIDKIDSFRKARNSVHINVYKTGEEIFRDLIRFFKDFKDIRDFFKEKILNS